MHSYSNPANSEGPPYPCSPGRHPMPLVAKPSAPLPPGPLGVKYDDSLTLLKINLVVMGIKPKSLTHAANTDVHLKYDDESFSILLEIFKMNKKERPPKKTVVDTRYFGKSKLPGKLLKCEYRLKKDQCVLVVHKASPALWANALTS